MQNKSNETEAKYLTIKQCKDLKSSSVTIYEDLEQYLEIPLSSPQMMVDSQVVVLDEDEPSV